MNVDICTTLVSALCCRHCYIRATFGWKSQKVCWAAEVCYDAYAKKVVKSGEQTSKKSSGEDIGLRSCHGGADLDRSRGEGSQQPPVHLGLKTYRAAVTHMRCLHYRCQFCLRPQNMLAGGCQTVCIPLLKQLQCLHDTAAY